MLLALRLWQIPMLAGRQRVCKMCCAARQAVTCVSASAPASRMQDALGGMLAHSWRPKQQLQRTNSPDPPYSPAPLHACPILLT